MKLALSIYLSKILALIVLSFCPLSTVYAQEVDKSKTGVKKPLSPVLPSRTYSQDEDKENWPLSQEPPLSQDPFDNSQHSQPSIDGLPEQKETNSKSEFISPSLPRKKFKSDSH